ESFCASRRLWRKIPSVRRRICLTFRLALANRAQACGAGPMALLRLDSRNRITEPETTEKKTAGAQLQSRAEREAIMFAVIKTGGKQYRVAAEEVLTIERLAGETGDLIEINSVLAVGEGADVKFG